MKLLKICKLVTIAVAQWDYPDKVPLFESDFQVQNLEHAMHPNAFKNIHTAQFVK